MKREEWARLIDFTYLQKPISRQVAADFLEAALKYNVRGICSYLEFFNKPLICAYGISFVAVVDFPDGKGGIQIKKQEAELAKNILNGIDEVDVVMDVQALKRSDYKLVEDGLRAVTNVFGKKTKVILETGALAKWQLPMACEIVNSVGAGWVKTSTGFNFNVGFDEKLEHVKILKGIIKKEHYDLKIKMSGGLETLEQLEKAKEAGADIFGISWQKAITILETLR